MDNPSSLSPAITLPSGDGWIECIASQLDRTGFACLADAVSPLWLDSARKFVEAELLRSGPKFFSLIRPDEIGSAAFDRITQDPAVLELLDGLVEHACPHAVREARPYNVLRVIAGPNGAAGAHQFHYDASVVTMLVPIIVPDRQSGMAGDLAIAANRRPIRGATGLNLIEKALSQNRFAWARSARTIGTAGGPEIQPLVPGNAYLFWGYRSYHGNLPCAPDSLRATLLVHQGDPHGNGMTMRTIRRIRQAVELRRRRA